MALAVPFYRSGLTKWDGFLNLSDSADALFSDEFKLHLFGGEMPFPAPHAMAFASGCMEILLPDPAGSRFWNASGRARPAGHDRDHPITAPEGWANFHLIWAATALAILVHGPGAFSLDALIGRAFGRSLAKRGS